MSGVPAAPSARTTLFAVNTEGETVADSWENESVNGAMPKALRARVETLNKRFGEDGEKCQQRERLAAANHKENIENVRRTAAQHTAKALRAAKARAAFGENMELMGNVMGNTETAVKLPKALDNRIAKLAPAPEKTTAAALSSKQDKAAKNRAAALQAKAEKAARANEKGRLARERKARAQREAVAEASGGRIFEVNVGKSDESVGDDRKGGWGVKTPLPPHLAKRLKKVQAKFDYDVMERYNRNAGNHSAKIEAIRAKAAVASERVARAAQRRALAKGDDNHFTVTLAGEAQDTTPAAGWASKPAMPQRLQERAETLSTRFGGSTTAAEDKQARAAANRAAFNNKKKAAARKFGAEVVEKAKKRRALAAGDANHFTVTEASFNANASADGEMTSAHGWGRQQGTKLPAALLDRLDEIAKSKTEKPDMER